MRLEEEAKRLRAVKQRQKERIREQVKVENATEII